MSSEFDRGIRLIRVDTDNLIGFRSGLSCGRIGKGGSKIKEIQEASGARLNASEQMLPGSTEVSSLQEIPSTF